MTAARDDFTTNMMSNEKRIAMKPVNITLGEINPDVIRRAAAQYSSANTQAMPVIRLSDSVIDHIRGNFGTTTYAQTAEVCGISHGKAATTLARMVKSGRLKVIESGITGRSGRPTIFGIA